MIDNYKSRKILRIVNTVLLSIAALMATFIILVSIFALTRPEDTLPTINRTGQNLSNIQSDDIRIYSGLERIRIPLANASIIILSVAFPYSANDITFTEELAAKTGEFRSIIIDYFSSLPASGANQINEDNAKQEILRRFNNILRLGRITVLYFTEMTIID